ncbi:thioredoxin reductase [Cellulomonas sp. PhB143]|nr:thioredoxin reductase [Cellulomonas sp. PhB143]
MNRGPLTTPSPADAVPGPTAPPDRYDVVVVGGGPAGLAAAVTLARSLRSVVVVDAGEPRNAPAEGAHNVLGHEGVAPRDLLAAGRREAEAYGVEVRAGEVVDARRGADGTFEAQLADGAVLRARRLLLATGLVDELPDVPGLAQHWGHDVLHCPYCHGWEVRGRRIGVLGAGPASVHQTLLFRQLSDDVTLFLDGMDDPEPETWEQLAALGVRVVDGRVEQVGSAGEGDGAGLSVRLAAEDFAVDALVVAPRFVVRGELYGRLGGQLTEHPMGRMIPTDPTGRTDVPGVWAAGNARDLSAMVVVSAGEGLMAGAGLNADLVAEDARTTVEARRAVASRAQQPAGA